MNTIHDEDYSVVYPMVAFPSSIDMTCKEVMFTPESPISLANEANDPDLCSSSIVIKGPPFLPGIKIDQKYIHYPSVQVMLQNDTG